MTPESTPRPVLGELSRCACGAESPASDDDNELIAWEDDHTQSDDCPLMVTWRAEREKWDDDLDTYRHPPLPAMTRYPAEVLPEKVAPAPFRHRRLKSDVANDMFGRSA